MSGPILIVLVPLSNFQSWLSVQEIVELVISVVTQQRLGSTVLPIPVFYDHAVKSSIFEVTPIF